MRSVWLDERFDAVLVHDAIMYVTTVPDLDAVVATTRLHVRKGGVVILAPDCVRETFRERTKHGGHDGNTRSLRYLPWIFDPDPSDTESAVQFVYVMRDVNGSTRVESEQRRFGLFPRGAWMDALSRGGFGASVRRDRWVRDVFVGKQL